MLTDLTDAVFDWASSTRAFIVALLSMLDFGSWRVCLVNMVWWKVDLWAALSLCVDSSKLVVRALR